VRKRHPLSDDPMFSTAPGNYSFNAALADEEALTG
jgi:hypothetical protein